MVLTQEKKNAIIKGLILGAIYLTSSIFSYYFIVDITKTGWLIVTGPYVFAVIVPIIVIAFFCIDMRKKLGGYWTFKQAVTSIFIMFMVCYAITIIGRDLVFSNFIEPDMTKKTEKVMLDVRAQALQTAGMKPDSIKTQITQLRKDFDSQSGTTPGVIIQGIVFNIMLIFVIAIIFAAIFKREPPYIAPANNEV